MREKRRKKERKRKAVEERGKKWKGLIYTQITLLRRLGNLVCCQC